MSKRESKVQSFKALVSIPVDQVANFMAVAPSIGISGVKYSGTVELPYFAELTESAKKALVGKVRIVYEVLGQRTNKKAEHQVAEIVISGLGGEFQPQD